MKGPLAPYSKFGILIKPADLLSGDIDKREGSITLVGKRSDDLNGAVKRRLLSDINRHFWENPRDADDSRLVFEAIEAEKGTKYYEKKDGSARLVLKISVGLAQYKPGSCGCC
ncbi:MAG: hypothetical protein QW568_00710 [Candidatus Anstonellaceae archaeon]